MRSATFATTLALLLPAFPALATDQGTSTDGMDQATKDEIRRQRLQTEYLMLEDARTTTFGSDFGTEGRLFTIRFALASWYREDAVNALPHPLARYAHLLDNTTKGALKDDVMADLPPFRVTLWREGETFHAELGAIEATLGHGALVNRYTNNPRGGFNLNAMGITAGAQAKSVGGSVLLGNIFQPGRFVGFNVRGRPLEWIYGTYSNFEPEAAGNVDYYSLLLSCLTLGVTGALDSDAARAVGDYATGAELTGVPGTAGGLSVEGDVGLNHSLLQVHAYANGTALGRTFEEQGMGADGHARSTNTTSALWGGGVNAGVRFNLMVELLKLGGQFEYRLAGPNYIPSYFDRYYEADRLSTPLGVPKISQRTMARHGYNLQLGAQFMKTVGVFYELGDLAQLDPRFGKNNATMRVGGILHLLGIVSLLGAYVNRGFQDYTKAFEPSLTGMWLGEARLSLFCISLVGRQWRTYERMADGHHVPRNGSSVLAEFQLGIL